MHEMKKPYQNNNNSTTFSKVACPHHCLFGVIALMVTSFPSFVVVASAQSDNNVGASPKKADIIYSQAIMQQ
jgi:hypothetical protein